MVQQSLLRDGVRIVTHCSIQRASTEHHHQQPGSTSIDGSAAYWTLLTATIAPTETMQPLQASEQQQQQQTIEVDAVLLATGRRPTVRGFGLHAANVRYSIAEGIVVDDYLRTSNPLIYAAGDCCSRYQFTHAAGESLCLWYM